MQKINLDVVCSASDLTYFAECRHRTWLDRCHLDNPMVKALDSESMLLVQEKGFEHEAAYLESLRRLGLTILEVQASELDEKVQKTTEAVLAGVDVIFQATLRRQNWIGHADFLIRTNKKSTKGLWIYEVVDTKLSHRAKTKFLVQLCFYSDLLSDITGALPESIHVELGSGRRSSYRLADYFDYYKHLVKDFESALSTHNVNPTSYPEPCQLCSICPWRDRCDMQRLRDDHLSLVANITKSQIGRLSRAGVSTMKELSELKELKVKGIQTDTLGRLAEQACLQVQEKESGQPCVKVIEQVEEDRGFARLPEPNSGDLFFDMEGDPMYPGGLEYLFGVYFYDNGKPSFRAFWAHNRLEEAEAFSAFMDFVKNWLSTHPKAYIYHYAQYEKTALKRLMSIHGLHEDSVDDLLRNKKMVDLYKVVRESLRISKPSYSIKQVEKFYSSKRTVDVTNAADSIVVYERWRQTQDPQLLTNIEDYNFDDCKSTWALREWLVGMRPNQLPWFGQSQNSKPETKQITQSSRSSEDRVAAQVQHEAYLAKLKMRLDSSPHTANLPDTYRQLLHHMIDFHRRAAKPAWWAIFERLDSEVEELFDDMEVIAGLEYQGRLIEGRIPRESIWKFPAQEFKCKVGDRVIVLDKEQMPTATILSIDEINCELTLRCAKIPNRYGLNGQRLSVSGGAPYNTEIIATAIKRFVESEIEVGAQFMAARRFLLREKPRFLHKQFEKHLIQDEEVSGIRPLKQITHLVQGMDKSCLFVQGPPGTGKTYTGSHVIAELVKTGKKVAIASNSHKAVNNLLERTVQVLSGMQVKFAAIKICSDEDQWASGPGITNLEKKDLLGDDVLNPALVPNLLAGTAWLFSSFQLTGCFDYIFIDEAGQVAAANTVAMGLCAENIILLGDQMQLGQPIQGDHPGESGLSSLDYLLGNKATIPPDLGVFLDRSYRMHPSVCNYISNTFYEGRLRHSAITENQGLVLHGNLSELLNGTGVYCLPVPHRGNSQRSEEEASAIAGIYNELIQQEFIGPEGEIFTMNAKEILVVAPYNAQVNLLKRRLPPDARVGTVDKFQGQEAQVILVSMTTSDEESMPRHLDFLFSKNRLNVAISRAKSLALIIMSPGLTEVRSESPETLALINTFLGLVDKHSVPTL